MNVQISTSTPTMSSREIADLVESRHDSVKRAMERLADREVIRFSPSVETSHNGPGARGVEVYLVGKRDSYIVVAQLSPEFTARLVDRWQELEGIVAPLAPVPALPQSFADALQLAADQARQIEQQSAKIAEQAPKVDVYERLLNADGLIGLQDAGRALLCHPNLFIRDVVIPDYCFRDGSRIVAKQTSVQRGLFENKAFTAPNDKVLLRAWMTPKGLAHFSTVCIPAHVRNPGRSVSAAPATALAAAATSH